MNDCGQCRQRITTSTSSVQSSIHYLVGIVSNVFAVVLLKKLKGAVSVCKQASGLENSYFSLIYVCMFYITG
jgi:hypothetical protein